MIFTTFQFLCFFLVVFGLYWTIPNRMRKPLLLFSSYYFYMCSVPKYITVILVITAIDYFAGLRIEASHTPRRKRLWLIASLLSNFGLLIVFKYSSFFASSLGIQASFLRFVLPLGISFHTFQAVSYTVEVYRGRVRAERNLLNYALYVAFFPQMVAGPIERPYNLLPQFRTDKRFDFNHFRSGMRLAIWGAFKKVVVADLLARADGLAYDHPHTYSGPLLACATFFFSVQIYCDFSGYSDIAIGIARMMGYDLMINFRQPYFSKSIREFWHNWHISLSTWFRDYLYIPLGGNRVPKLRFLANIMVVFVISGMWHGANWTFAVWGFLHGIYLIVGNLSEPLRLSVKKSLQLPRLGVGLAIARTLFTFFLATVAWVFFRANNLQDGAYILRHMFSPATVTVADLVSLGLPRFELAVAFLMLLVTAVVDWCLHYKPDPICRLWNRRPARWALTYACIFSIIFFGQFGGFKFIYFQF